MNGMKLSDAVQSYSLEPNEKASVLDYLVGEAEFIIKFIHDDDLDLDTLEHTGSLRVKLRHFAKSSGQMMVVVTHNDMPGLRITEKLLTLYLDEFHGQEDLLFHPTKEINGFEFDDSYITSACEWRKAGTS
jgi:hypothetical protein